MSESHAISALRRKRAELSGELVELEKQRKAIVSRINHADETLRLFGFQGDPNDIPARMKCPRLFRRGQLQRMVFAAIRDDRCDRPAQLSQGGKAAAEGKRAHALAGRLEHRVGDGRTDGRQARLTAAPRRESAIALQV